MTYARARLLLGMFGVGSMVVLSGSLLLSGWPLERLPVSQVWEDDDFWALAMLFGILIALLFPLDLLGGFLLPNRWRPNTITFATFLLGWLRGVVFQAILFVTASLLILFMGRWLGVWAATLAVAAIAVILVAGQLQIAKVVGALTVRVDSSSDPHSANPSGASLSTTLAECQALVSSWGWKPYPIVVLDHHDTGFTGGIVGVPGMETVIVSAGSLNNLSTDQLAVVVARRLEAIRSGSRTRGLGLAIVWVMIGFALSTLLPGAGVTSVGQLTMTSLGFTVWTFLGLLTLPTLSRQASYAIDDQVLVAGVSPANFQQALKKLDSLQDDEPSRSALIETIFHPVPSVEKRTGPRSSAAPDCMARRSDNLISLVGLHGHAGSGGPLQRRSPRVVGTLTDGLNFGLGGQWE